MTGLFGILASTCRGSKAFNFLLFSLTLGIKTAQKPYIVWSLGPKALKYEFLDS